MSQASAKPISTCKNSVQNTKCAVACIVVPDVLVGQDADVVADADELDRRVRLVGADSW